MSRSIIAQWDCHQIFLFCEAFINYRKDWLKAIVFIYPELRVKMKKPPKGRLF